MRIFCCPHNKSGHDTVYALLKYAYFDMYGKDLPEIGKSENGKPYFVENTGVHFSLSHCKTHVLCGISSNPIGVDIESPRSISKKAERFYCVPGELELFNPLDLWVLKESYIKLIGGIMPMAKTFRFSKQNGCIITPDEHVFSKLYQIEGCIAAVSSLYINPPDKIEYV